MVSGLLSAAFTQASSRWELIATQRWTLTASRGSEAKEDDNENNNVINPDMVRLNCYYYHRYSFIKDIQKIFCTVLGKKMKYAGEMI